MARTVRDTNLETRTARSRLPPCRKPYWRTIDQGCHVGYYKGKRTGSWISRYFLGDGRYVEATLGRADDVQDADGIGVLSFSQAQANARHWFSEQARREAGVARLGPYRVADAMKDYLDWYEMHRKDIANARYRANALIFPALGDKDLTQLTPQIIRAWHEGLAKTPPRLRTSRAKPQRHRETSDDPEYRRRRRVTANKSLTLLKAALNHAWRDGKIASDEAWRRVKPFAKVDAPKVRYLTVAEISRLVNACDSDFRQLVQGALLTGCRYGELIGMHRSDFNPDTGSVYVRPGKAGKARHVTLADEGRTFFNIAVASENPDGFIFLRSDGKPWAKSHQARPLTAACSRAKISPPISFHTLRHTHASHLAMRGVPLIVIAHHLGHTDTRMAERHYAHLSPSYMADAIRAGLPQFGILESSNLRPLKQRLNLENRQRRKSAEGKVKL
jgi:integrase